MTTAAGYSRMQIALHWIVVLLIAQQYLFKGAIASAWDSFTKDDETEFSLMIAVHVIGGALILITALWRLVIKARRGDPGVTGDNPVLIVMARLTYLGLYALMILMPISGAVAWFGGVQAAATAHGVMKILLLALIALHVAAALYHQFVLKDGVMERMRRAAN